MTDNETFEMMSRCKQEILSLRAYINRIQPKADAYDNIAGILRLLPQPSIGMGEDVVGILDKRINEMLKEKVK